MIYMLDPAGTLTPVPAGDIALPIQASADLAEYPLAPIVTIGDIVIHAITEPAYGLPRNVIGSAMTPVTVYGSIVLTGPATTGDRHHVLTETTAFAALDLIDKAQQALVQARLRAPRRS